jgi:hypothetical protein
MAVTTYPSTASPSHHPQLRAVPETVRVLDCSDTLSRWQSAAWRARSGELLLRFSTEWGVVNGKRTYQVASTSRPGAFHHIDERLVCDCEAGQHGHVCRHVARIARWLWDTSSLVQCSACGAWEHRLYGEYRHVGGRTPGDDPWTCYRCLRSVLS